MRVRMETADTATLFLAADERFEYAAGQFLTIDPRQFPALKQVIGYLEDAKGQREKPRAYSLASAPHEEHAAITIKEEPYISGETVYPPLVSPLLTYQIPAGSRMKISGFTGAYTYPDDIAERADAILHVCAGSGIVPNFGLIKHSLHCNDGLRHTLVYSNKTVSDIIFARDLEQLRQRYPDRFEIVNCITREDPAGLPCSRRGRIDPDLLSTLIKDTSNRFVFCCGPGISSHERKAAGERGETPAPKFVETMLPMLQEIGLDKTQIKRESWG